MDSSHPGDLPHRPYARSSWWLALRHPRRTRLNDRHKNYRSQYADHRRWPIEKLAIEVGIILVQHAVGVLIIEEIQARNFSMSPNREEMLLFILRVLNFGVPVVLVGNPLGFVGLDEFSQDINRLTENEPIHLMPADIADTEWTEGLGCQACGVTT